MKRWQWIALGALGGVATICVLTWLALLDLYEDEDEGTP